MGATNRAHKGLKAVFICLHITLSHFHHHLDLYDDIDHINAFQVHSVACVSMIKQFL